MSEIPKHYLAYAGGGPFLLLGLIMASAITPSPAESALEFYLPPTLPGVLIWAGGISIAVGLFFGYLRR